MFFVVVVVCGYWGNVVVNECVVLSIFLWVGCDVFECELVRVVKWGRMLFC